MKGPFGDETAVHVSRESVSHDDDSWPLGYHYEGPKASSYPRPTRGFVGSHVSSGKGRHTGAEALKARHAGILFLSDGELCIHVLR